MDLVFCLEFDNTIHFGMNPSRGGIPAIDNNFFIKFENKNILFLFVLFILRVVLEFWFNIGLMDRRI